MRMGAVKMIKPLISLNINLFRMGFSFHGHGVNTLRFWVKRNVKESWKPRESGRLKFSARESLPCPITRNTF
jgi:hypothetical protein